MNPVLTGVEINPELSSELNWYLYFTGGTFEEYNSIKTFEPFVIKLDQNYYTDGFGYYVVMNMLNNDIQIVPINEINNPVCSRYIQIGGFIVQGCKIRLIYPESDCITYIRAFSDEFTQEFELTPKQINCTEPSGNFGQGFGSGFNIVQP